MIKLNDNTTVDLHEKIEGFQVQEILYLLVGAWEGGSNYWIESVEIGGSPEKKTIVSSDYFPSFQLVPFLGGHLKVTLDEEANNEVHELNLEKIKEAIVLMRQNFNGHYCDWVKQNDDAATSDVFLQLCLFKDVIYG